MSFDFYNKFSNIKNKEAGIYGVITPRVPNKALMQLLRPEASQTLLFSQRLLLSLWQYLSVN